MKNIQNDWPILRTYDQAHLARIALPLGGIGTGTVSLGGRGDLRDWEVMNRPAKGFVPPTNWRDGGPFFALHVHAEDGTSSATRCLEGPLDVGLYEGEMGSPAPNHGLPRFRQCQFKAVYPFGQVHLADPDLPVKVRIRAFNPLIPGDADASGYPCAVLRYRVTNIGDQPLNASVCGSLPNFIGYGLDMEATDNINTFRQDSGVQGVALISKDVPQDSEFWGTLALVTPVMEGVTHRTAWREGGHWGESILDFWDDFGADGALSPREAEGDNHPMASLNIAFALPPGASHEVTFILAWHFPNRQTWTPYTCECGASDPRNTIGNYYATQFDDAWDAAETLAQRLPELEAQTRMFVQALCDSDLPDVIKEAALFNLSTLRTQTCFRTPDGHFFAWEGTCNQRGCCHGSCTHVWNYEQATAFLFGELARSMREVEFLHATRDNGFMSFRVNLPLDRTAEMGTAAADGQMGCVIKAYREWQLSGDDAWLRRLWPKIRKALEFCWVPGGWDADQDGVMEGCQHNTMDVEYYGPNPQMGLWYLGALRAAEAMATYVGETTFAAHCRALFEQGSAWLDAHLFNGEYYEHRIQLPKDPDAIAEGLRMPWSASRPDHEDYQLGEGCLVDQLVGQLLAHVCGLGYLVKLEHVRTTLKSILKYNWRDSFVGHFNNMRSYVLGDESGLLMAHYPHERPALPFPYFNEVMTGFEYTAAVGMLYEGMLQNPRWNALERKCIPPMVAEGIKCIQAIRARYDGRKRSPFDEAECGHHYGRAMTSWAAVLALTGFHYSAVTGTMTFAAREGTHFWSNGYAWGTCRQRMTDEGTMEVTLRVLHGTLTVRTLVLTGMGALDMGESKVIKAGETIRLNVES